MKVLHFNCKRLVMLCLLMASLANNASASSHREAPLISNDPLADNTDVYAFRCPDAPKYITIIADFIPFEVPDGGPNYYTFGENVRYEIHIKNKTTTTGDDITYRFTFTHVNEDTTTFFNIRLGKQNIKTTYTCEKSTDGGNTFTTIVTNGIVPPNNIGPRSINNGKVGLDTTYNALIKNSIVNLPDAERIFCGPADDPFFVDLGGAFDVGNFRPEGNNINPTKDAVARFNVHSIALQVPIKLLQKDGKSASEAVNILDPDFIIGVWASTSRQQIKTLNADGYPEYSGNWVQVSRLGMPLTNEAVIPVGKKDMWNATRSNSAGEADFTPYFENPELALYMDGSQFGNAVPALTNLRIQKKSLGSFNFRNGQPGLYPLKGTPAVEGTALDDDLFGNLLLPDDHSPRAVDILPVFYTGVPNLSPYQLATGKPAGKPLAPGKPFVNNFLPTLGDMLRLNMAVPATDRSSADFSTLGLIQAAVLGLTDTRFNGSKKIQFIPNMDGFPNGRRLEDDITTIELQAVSGVVLSAIGLWYDDYKIGGNPVTQDFLNVYTFTAGPTHNDTTLKASFPYVQTPWRGFNFTQQPRF